ncbi:multidrug resistance protein, MFS superfamily [Legionella busanensis]|uniref:Multidrug resistance protein, MFS superfamily n=1 Tax=Legionella busanensis TaxID=190655 RepID=A0A378JNZ4_9GAMM|nr:MFS transporter [Legionella busanensis]STX52431.1 multidrug resistance protein, MFS superfamily [Legionella busanensis]
MPLFIFIFTLSLVIFNLTLPIMAGIYIVGDLGGSTFISFYSVSFFCLGNTLSTPLGKPDAMKLSPVKFYLLCLVLMLLFSWLCATATSYFNFILFRFLEGVASGPLYLLITLVLMPKVFSSERQAKLLPYLFICFSFTPVLGASWGAWVAYTHHWRFLFFTNIPICLILMILVAVSLRHLDKEPQEVHFNKLNFFLYSISIICIGTALMVGQELDWFRSNLINVLFIIGGVSTLLFIFNSLNSAYSVINLRLFKNFFFTFAMLNIGVLFGVYYGMVILLGLWLKLYVNYTPNWIALIIFTMAFGAWIPLFLDYKRADPRLPLAIALLFFAISFFYTATFNSEVNFNRIAFSRILAGLGLALFLPPLFKLPAQTFSAEKTKEAVNCFHIIRLYSSGLGTALFVTLWQRRQVFYYERLGSKLTFFSQQVSYYLTKASQFNLKGKAALAELNSALLRRATALALDDCFYLMAWLSVILIVILLITFYPPLRLSPQVTYHKPSL